MEFQIEFPDILDVLMKYPFTEVMQNSSKNQEGL